MTNSKRFAVLIAITIIIELMRIIYIYNGFFFVGGTGLPSRTKYVVDPSVQANPYGTSRNQFAPTPIQQPPQPFQPVTQPFQPPAQTFQPSNFQTNALSNTLQPNPVLNPTPLLPSFPQNPPGFGTPLPPVNTQPSFQNNAVTGGGFPAPPTAGEILQPQEIGQSAMNYLPANAAPGWNDPPVLNRSVRPQVGTLICTVH